MSTENKNSDAVSAASQIKDEDILVLTPEEPYAGLASFTKKNKSYFFGREKEIEKIFSIIEHSFLTLVFGKSGIGKSSILKAGLFPELKESKFLPIDIKWESLDHSNYQSGKGDIYKEILSIIEKSLVENGIDVEPESRYKDFIDKNQTTIKALGSQDKLWFYLNTNSFWDKDNNLVIPVILIDQFEIIFTSYKNNSFFFSFLEAVAEFDTPEVLNEKDFHYLFNPSRVKYKLLIGLQEDFLPHITMYEKQIPSLLKSKYRLQAFEYQQAKDAIMRPAEEKNLVDGTTAEAIIKYLAEAELPVGNEEIVEIEPIFLSVVCKKLNNERIRRKQEKITVALLNELKEKNKLLKDFYEDTLKEIVPDKTQRAAVKKEIEENLLTESGEINPVEETVMKNKLSVNGIDGPALLNLLIRKRILRREPWLGKQRVYIIHNKLAKAIAEERNKRRLVEKVKKEDEEKLKKVKSDADKIKLALLIGVPLAIYIIILFYRNERLATSERNTFASLNEELKKQGRKNDLLYRENLKSKTREYNDSLRNERFKTDSIAKEDSIKSVQRSVREKEKSIREKENLIREKNIVITRYDSLLSEYEIQNNFLQKEVFKNQIENDFYKNNITSSDLDSGLYNNISSKLLSLKTERKNDDYYKLLEAVNTAVQAKKSIFEYPTDIEKGYELARNLWKNYNDTIVHSLLLSFLNNTLYYKQSEDLKNRKDFNSSISQSGGASALSVAGGKNRFYLNFNNNILHGSILPGSIRFDGPPFLLKDSIGKTAWGKTIYCFNYPQVNTVTFAGDNIRAVLDTNKIVTLNVKEAYSDRQNINVGYFAQSAVSPNGRYLITKDSSRTSKSKLWPLTNLNQSSRSNRPIEIRHRSPLIKLMKFSDNSQKLMVLGTDGLLDLFALDDSSQLKSELTPKPKSDSLPPLIIANFYSKENDSIIALDTYGRIMFRSAREPNKSPTENNVYFRLPDSLANFLSTGFVRSISMAPNNKAILIETGFNTILCKLNSDNSAFGEKISFRDLSFKKFNINHDKSKTNNNQNTSFVNDSLILSLDSDGKVRLWKIYPEFNSLQAFFNSVEVPSRIENVISSGDREKISDLAYDFLYKSTIQGNNSPDTFYIIKAKDLFYKLLDFDSSSSYNTNASQLIFIYQQLIKIDSTGQHLDKYFEEMKAISKKYTDNYPLRSLSSYFGNLSWYSIKNNNFKLALEYAKKGIEADSTNDFVYTNLALGYLFTKDFANAEKVYDSLKNAYYRNGLKSFAEAFKQDFRDLEALGIINKNEPDIYEEVKKIKRDILKAE